MAITRPIDDIHRNIISNKISFQPKVDHSHSSLTLTLTHDCDTWPWPRCYEDVLAYWNRVHRSRHSKAQTGHTDSPMHFV